MVKMAATMACRMCLVCVGLLANVCASAPVPMAVPLSEIDADIVKSLLPQARPEDLPSTCSVLFATGRNSLEYVTVCASLDTVMLHAEKLNVQVLTASIFVKDPSSLARALMGGTSSLRYQLLGNLQETSTLLPLTTANARIHHGRHTNNRHFNADADAMSWQSLQMREVMVWVAAVFAVFVIKRLLADIFSSSSSHEQSDADAYAHPPCDKSDAPPAYTEDLVAQPKSPTIKQV